MTFAFFVFLVGGVLLVAGKRNQTIGEVLSGSEPKSEPQHPEDDPRNASTFAADAVVGVSDIGTGATDAVTGGADALFHPGGGWGGSKAVVDIAVAIAHRNHLRVISTKRATRNNTASGGMSDHFVGNTTAYAADLSNGSSPTPEMDKTAREIANTFGLSWSGSGVVNGTFKAPNGKSYRVQMLYRTNTGGNHYNHVHFGARVA